MVAAMFKYCLILIAFVSAGCSVDEKMVLDTKRKKSTVSSINKQHCVEIGEKAAAAWIARGKALPSKDIKKRIRTEYSRELIYRGITKEVKSKLLQMTDYVVDKAYELKPPFKTESEAKNFGKEYCEKHLQDNF